MSSSLYDIEKLDETNYDFWSVQIKALLVHQNLWSTICGDKPTKEAEIADWLKRDEKAISTIILSITPMQIPYIKSCKSANEAWNVLHEIHRPKRLLSKVRLFRELLNMKIGDADCVHQHVRHFNSIVEKLGQAGFELQEELYVIILLGSLPRSYESFVIELDTKDDVPKLNELELKLTEEAERRRLFDQNKQYQQDINDVLFNQNGKRQKLHIGASGSIVIANSDLLTISEKMTTNEKFHTEEFKTNELITHEEPLDCSEYNSDSVSERNENFKEQALEKEFVTEEIMTKELIIHEETLDCSEDDSDVVTKGNEYYQGKTVEKEPLTEEFGYTKVKIIQEPLGNSEHDPDSDSNGNGNCEEESAEEFTAEELMIKDETLNCNESDTDGVIDDDTNEVGANYIPVSDAEVFSKREEYDKFIAENFKDMNCNLCRLPLNDFSDMCKHFEEIHSLPGYFVCCKTKYFSRFDLVDHLKSHLNPYHFKCSQCERVMWDRQQLESHITRTHTETENREKKHRCDECGRSFAFACRLRSHKLSHIPKEREAKLQYDKCKKLDKFPDVLEHPLSKSGKYGYCCPECSKVSPTRNALYQHFHTVHVYTRIHKCTVCTKAFKTARTLQEHMTTHTGSPLNKCPFCPKRFSYRSKMYTHCKNKHPKEHEEAKQQRLKKKNCK